MRGQFFALMVLAWSSSAYAAGDVSAERARKFIGALSTDKATAQSMVSPQAEMGAGDVGGPFDLKVFDVVLAKCSFDTNTLTSKPLDMPGRRVIAVSVPLNCNSDAGPVSNTAEFGIEGDKIVSFYLPLRKSNG